jgi:hypothetical protein
VIAAVRPLPRHDRPRSVSLLFFVVTGWCCVGCRKYLGCYIGNMALRVACPLAQRVESSDGVQTLRAHQVADSPLDDHAIVQGVLQLLGKDTVILSCQRAADDFCDQVTVGA